jgi:hypothetical protein
MRVRMMIEHEDKIVGLETRSGIDGAQDVDELPYWIELWKLGNEHVERVLGRAASVQLARAIFTSAQSEFPGRRITIRRGRETVLDSEG